MSQECRRVVKIGISSQLNGRYMVTRKIGEGGFGAVFEVCKLSNPNLRYALKVEAFGVDKNEEFLKMEYKVLQNLQEAKAKHVVQLQSSGKTDKFFYIVMTLLGPSLGDLRKMMPEQKFTAYTNNVCFLQAVDAIKEIHDIGFVHRDVKPSNFSVGRLGSPMRRWIYIIDFGLCRQILFNKKTPPYIPSRKVGDKYLREPRRQAPMRGTMRYCSLSAHRREELGRHDDLWSLWYMIAEMSIGELPWARKEKAETEKLKEETTDEVAKKLPEELAQVMRHLRLLSYGDPPNYRLVRLLGCALFKRSQFSLQDPLDWEPEAKSGNIFRMMHQRKSPDTRIFAPKQFEIEDPGDFDLTVQPIEAPATCVSGRSDPDDTLEGEVDLKASRSVDQFVAQVKTVGTMVTKTIGTMVTKTVGTIAKTAPRNIDQVSTQAKTQSSSRRHRVTQGTQSESSKKGRKTPLKNSKKAIRR